MRIGIQTWGSEGDIRPFVALASGLVEAGTHGTIANAVASRLVNCASLVAPKPPCVAQNIIDVAWPY